MGRTFGLVFMLSIIVSHAYAGGGDTTVVKPNPDEDVLRPYVESKGRWFIQADAGVNWTFLGVRDTSEFVDIPSVRTRIADDREVPATMFQSANGMGLLFGASIGYEFPKLFGIRLRVDYDVRSASNSGTTFDTCNIADAFGNPLPDTIIAITDNYTVTAKYVTFSLLPSLRIGDFYMFAGPSIGIPTGEKEIEFTETQTIDPNSDCRYYYTPTDSLDATHTRTPYAQYDSLANTRIALKVGAGYNIAIGTNLFLVPQIAFDLGFNDAMNNDGLLYDRAKSDGSLIPFAIVNRKMTFNALQLTLGIRYNL